MLQASTGSTGDGARKRSSTFSQMQSKGYLDRVKEKRREVTRGNKGLTRGNKGSKGYMDRVKEKRREVTRGNKG